MYNWVLPNKVSDHCVLRIRYNISTNDFDGWSQSQQSTVNISSKYVKKMLKLKKHLVSIKMPLYKKTALKKIYLN